MFESQFGSENDEKYSAELVHIKNEIKKILTRVGNKFDELLLGMAAKFLILKTIHKNKVGDKALRYFPDAKAFVNFAMWLTGSPHKPQGYSDNDIGKYCTILFLVYDNCVPDKYLYQRIVGKSLNIIYSRFPESRLFELVESEKLQLRDVLKDCDNAPQNNTEIIDHLKEYLSRVKAYLDAEGILIDEEQQAGEQNRKRKSRTEKLALIIDELQKDSKATSPQIARATGLQDSAVRQLWGEAKKMMKTSRPRKGQSNTDVADPSASCSICRVPLSGSFECEICKEIITGKCKTCHYTNEHPDDAIP